MDEPILLRIPEAARLLSMAPSTVYELARRELIPSVRLSAGVVRIPRDALLKMLAERTVGTPP